MTVFVQISGLRFSFKYLPLFVFLLCSFGLSSGAAARNSYFTMKMNDSLITEEGASIVYNNIHFNNLSPRLIPIIVIVDCPDDWRLLGQRTTEMVLRPDEEQIVPLSFIKQPNTRAEWQPVTIRVVRKYGFDTLVSEFYIKAKPTRRIFLTAVSDKEVFFSDEKNANEIAVRLKNQGNTPETYSLVWKNDMFRINETFKLTLPPGKDTVCTLPVTIARRDLSYLKKELLECSVYGGETKKSIYFVLNTVSSFKKENASAYNIMKAGISGGMLNYGDNMLTYYVSASANVNFNESDYLNFNYRSKQYGILNSFEKNIFNLQVKYKNFLLNAGQVIDSRYFITYGNGIKLKYTQGNTIYTIWATKHYRNFFQNNDNGGVSIRYKLNKFTVENVVAANTDPRAHVNSAISDNKVILVDNKNVTLSVNGGAGIEHRTIDIPGKKEDAWGSSVGYDLRYGIKKWNVISNFQKNSDNYPGIYKGLNRHYHELRRVLNNQYSISVFYQYNAMTYNYFRDSLYNSDVFTYNMERYGVRGTWVNKNNTLLLGTGILKQTGIVNTLPKYQFLELNYRYHTGKNFNFSINSLSGYSMKPGDKVDVAWISNSSMQISYRYFGFNALYVRTPMYGGGEHSVNNRSAYSETVNLSPYVSYSFSNRFNALLNYNVSKLLNNNSITQYLGGNISYSGLRNGLSISLNTSIPLQSTQNDQYANFYNVNYFNLTLTKNLNIPIITKRKYHTIRLNTFFDENNNGIKDENESPLRNAYVQIRDVPFKTDSEGQIVYKNLSDGAYDIDLSRATYKGITPSEGFSQTLELRKDTTVTIAYKKSRTITGKVHVILDTVSHVKFTPDQIKVLLSDDNGFVTSTITDASGNFYFNVPAGTYTVSLNPNAFDDVFKPEQLSYAVDLVENQNWNVSFTIKQKNRQVKIKNVIID